MCCWCSLPAAKRSPGLPRVAQTCRHDSELWWDLDATSHDLKVTLNVRQLTKRSAEAAAAAAAAGSYAEGQDRHACSSLPQV